ncbi:MAG: hypothetical protein HLUCCA12_12080 [Rhodobacteraceae bacterium HLUCCA12]|nr:MAG: hypothetical protein HLUCCA12_12080 [Rhodobacteraceae bacterium HLUCCA12]
MSKHKFSTAALERLLEIGFTQAEAAQQLGVTRGAVSMRIRREKLALPKGANDPAVPGKAASASEPVDDYASLVETGGRYLELRAWAQERGLTHTQALQRWHQLRIPAQARRP